jgi:hypothetical protein
MGEYVKDIEYYIEIGAVSVEGIDEDGEFIFLVTEKAKAVAPELWKAHTEYIDDAMLKLFESGFLDVSYDENLEATFSLSQEGEEMAKELGLVEMNKEEE